MASGTKRIGKLNAKQTRQFVKLAEAIGSQEARAIEASVVAYRESLARSRSRPSTP